VDFLAQCGLDVAQALQDPLASLFRVARPSGRRRGGAGRSVGGGAKETRLILEVFFKAVGLEQVVS